MMKKRHWVILYGVGGVIFAGGYFLRVYEKSWFPVFVLGCMAYGLVASVLFFRNYRSRKLR